MLQERRWRHRIHPQGHRRRGCEGGAGAVCESGAERRQSDGTRGPVIYATPHPRRRCLIPHACWRRTNRRAHRRRYSQGGTAMTWKPIETAKKGVAVVYDAKKGIISNAFLHDNDGTAYYSNVKAYDVTHWWDFGDGKSMPEPPDKEAEER